MLKGRQSGDGPSRPDRKTLFEAHLEAFLAPSRARIIGAVLFGSSANGDADKNSDHDVFVVLADGEPHKQIAAFHGYRCDLLYMSLERTRSYLSADSRANNNPILRALATGRAVIKTAQLLGLVSDAQAAFLRKPSAPSSQEVQMHIVASVQTSQFIAKCKARAREDRRWAAILDARLGTFLTQHVEAYCRIHRLWSNGFWQILRNERGEYRELVRLITIFLDSASEEEKQLAILDFARSLITAGCRLLGQDPSFDLHEAGLAEFGEAEGSLPTLAAGARPPRQA